MHPSLRPAGDWVFYASQSQCLHEGGCSGWVSEHHQLSTFSSCRIAPTIAITPAAMLKPGLPLCLIASKAANLAFQKHTKTSSSL
jgi:hypothetical protein